MTIKEIIKRNLLAIKDWQISCQGAPIQELYWRGVPRTERHSISRAEIARQREAALADAAAAAAEATRAKAEAEAKAKAESELKASMERLLRRSTEVVSLSEMMELTKFLEEPVRSALRNNWGELPRKSYPIIRLGWRVAVYTFSDNVYIRKEQDDAWRYSPGYTLFVGGEKYSDDGTLARVLLRAKPLKR